MPLSSSTKLIDCLKDALNDSLLFQIFSVRSSEEKLLRLIKKIYQNKKDEWYNDMIKEQYLYRLSYLQDKEVLVVNTWEPYLYIEFSKLE